MSDSDMYVRLTSCGLESDTAKVMPSDVLTLTFVTANGEHEYEVRFREICRLIVYKMLMGGMKLV